MHWSTFESLPLKFPQILVPPLPGKAIKRQLPFRGDDGKCIGLHLMVIRISHVLCTYVGIFDDEFIEERRKGLEEFVNK